MDLLAKKRGVSRSIDFLISFVLFMVFIASMLLITNSINVDLFANPVSRPSEEAQSLTRRIFGLDGSDILGNSNWGDDFYPLSSFGLSDGWHSHYSLDPNKLSRVHPLLQNSPSSFLRDAIISYTSVHTLLELETTETFSLSLCMLLNVQLTLSGSTALTLTAHVTDLDGDSPKSALVHFYAFSLTSLEFFDFNPTSLQTDGKARLSFNLSQNNYMFFAVTQLGTSWGISNYIFATSNGIILPTPPTLESALFTQHRIAYHSTTDDSSRVVIVAHPSENSYNTFTSSFDSNQNTVNIIPSQLPLDFIFCLVYEPQNNILVWESLPTIFDGVDFSSSTFHVSDPLSEASYLVRCANTILTAKIKYWRF